MAYSDTQETAIPLSQLNLWDENARFPDKYYNQEESELIAYFLSKKSFKIVDLAKAIVQDFDLPQLEKLVVYNNGEEYIVLEGNRRITAYKLLANPQMATDSEIKNLFTQLKSQINISAEYTLQCIVTHSKQEAERYLDRKHLQNNNEIQWGDTERAHYKARRGKADDLDLLKKELYKKIQQLDIPDVLKEKVLGPGYVTSFNRVLCSSVARSIFNMKLDVNNKLTIGDKDFDKKLIIIIQDISNKKDQKGNTLHSRTLNKADDIEKYLKNIDINNFDVVKDEIEESRQTDLVGDEQYVPPSSSQKKKSNPKSTSRNYLIPRTCILVINEVKINNIYRELRDNLLLNDSKEAVPNAVSFSFRVFLELTLDFFIQKHHNQIHLKEDTKLAGKITKVCEFLLQNSLASTKELQNISKVATQKEHLLHISNFHEYLHTYVANPSPMELKAKWDNLEGFFKLIWDILEKKRK